MRGLSPVQVIDNDNLSTGAFTHGHFIKILSLRDIMNYMQGLSLVQLVSITIPVLVPLHTDSYNKLILPCLIL